MNLDLLEDRTIDFRRATPATAVMHQYMNELNALIRSHKEAILAGMPQEADMAMAPFLGLLATANTHQKAAAEVYEKALQSGGSIKAQVAAQSALDQKNAGKNWAQQRFDEAFTAWQAGDTGFYFQLIWELTMRSFKNKICRHKKSLQDPKYELSKAGLGKILELLVSPSGLTAQTKFFVGISQKVLRDADLPQSPTGFQSLVADFYRKKNGKNKA